MSSSEGEVQHQKLEAQMVKLREQLNQLSTQNLTDRELINELELTLRDEERPDLIILEKMYREAGIIFPDLVLKRFKEVEDFHNSITENRRIHINLEIDAAKARIRNRNSQKQKIESGCPISLASLRESNRAVSLDSSFEV